MRVHHIYVTYFKIMPTYNSKQHNLSKAKPTPNLKERKGNSQSNGMEIAGQTVRVSGIILFFLIIKFTNNT